MVGGLEVSMQREESCFRRRRRLGGQKVGSFTLRMSFSGASDLVGALELTLNFHYQMNACMELDGSTKLSKEEFLEKIKLQELVAHGCDYHQRSSSSLLRGP